MDLRKMLEKQIELLDEINQNVKDIELEIVRNNINTIDDLIRTIHLIENN